MSGITFFTCPQRCDAGGRELEDGHIFDTDRDFIHCGECNADYTIPRVSDWRAFERFAQCERCRFIGALSCSGGSMFCRCGLSAMDWCLMEMP